MTERTHDDATFVDRFWSRVVKRGDDECWGWTGAMSRIGYGSLSRLGKNAGAHRVAYELAHGPIPTGYQIDHTCRNRSCVNPSHLEAVTPYENWRRGYRARGGHRATSGGSKRRFLPAACHECNAGMWLFPKVAICSRCRLRVPYGGSGASQFRGVSRSGLRWAVRIRIDGKRRHIGSFDSEVEAARAYDAAAAAHRGAFAVLNFPLAAAAPVVAADKQDQEGVGR